MPDRARRWIIAIVGMAVGVLGLGVIVPMDRIEGDVTYVLTWDTDGITTVEGGWVTVNDLGYTITVTDGILTTFSATMVDCDHGHGIFEWLFGFAAPGIAEAGHTTTGGDSALVGGPVVERLDDPETDVLGTAEIDEPAYCQGHTAWGTLDPDEPTLEVTATWTSSDGEAGAIDLTTTMDWGVGGDLVDNTGAVHIETGEPATVEISHSLATMFDGIDLATVDDTSLAMGVFRALADSTRFTVTAGGAHA